MSEPGTSGGGNLPAIPTEINHTNLQRAETQIQSTLNGGAAAGLDNEMRNQYARTQEWAAWLRQVAQMGESSGVQETGKSTQQQIAAQSEAANKASSALAEAAQALAHAVKALGAVADAAAGVVVKSTAAVGS